MTTIPSKAIRSVRDPMVRILLRDAVRHGSTLDYTGGGHVLVIGPTGGRVVVAVSPRSSHVHKTVRLQLEKQGCIPTSDKSEG